MRPGDTQPDAKATASALEAPRRQRIPVSNDSSLKFQNQFDEG